LNLLDYLVLLGTILGIAAYGVWRTRGRRDLNTYLKGKGDISWPVIGLSVMATQASAITFLSTPGQGYKDGLGFVQNYFGASFALIIISAFFLPIYRRLKVYTAYEFLGQRFDKKTRLLGAFLFLLQRGLGADDYLQRPCRDCLHRCRWQRCRESHAKVSIRRNFRGHGGGLCGADGKTARAGHAARCFCRRGRLS
jgi:hypothetical protein